jgi:glycine cleavage system regulatory protein
MALTSEERLVRLEERCKLISSRLTKIEKIYTSINDINLNIQELALTQKGILETMKDEQDIRREHEERILSLENKPIKNYEKVKWIVITAVLSSLASGIVGIVIGFFIK